MSIITADRPRIQAPPRPAPVADSAPLELRDISPRLLLCFLTVAEELHFGRAADRLFVAQSALSRSIQQLERLLGYPLFVRTTRRVELTARARRLMVPAEDILKALAELAGDLACDHSTLRVAHVPGSDTIALILDRLVGSGSTVTVHEQTMAARDQLDALRDGRLDVAICRAPGRLPDGLRSRLVRLDPLLVAVIGREAGNQRPVNPQRRIVAATGGPLEDPDYVAFLDGYERRGACRLRRVAVGSGSGMEAYAIRRSGLHAFVTLASRGVRLDRACPVAGTVPVQAYYPWAVLWRDRRRSAAVEAFLAAADAVGAASGWQDVSRLPGEPWIAGEPSDA